MTDLDIRFAKRSDVDALAALWYSGWQDAHQAILPEVLRMDRTLDSFHRRLIQLLSHVRIACDGAKLSGFSLVKDDELYQFYVAAEARGTNVAVLLMADALTCFRKNGVKKAWLACAIGNERAARFYNKMGWHQAGETISCLKTCNGEFKLNVWRYEFFLTDDESTDVRAAWS